MKCPYCIKICKKCKKLLVANKMNFNKCKTGKFGLRPECKECQSSYHEKWRQEHVEHRKEYLEKWYEEHKEEKSEYDKKYRKENKEKIKETKKKYYKNNKEEVKEKVKQYREENPDKIFNQNNKRRLLEETQGDGISKDQWYEMMEFFDWKCAYSGMRLNKENRSIDHIIPLKNGGEHEIWNCVPMYMPYNSSKSTSEISDWYEQQEFYSEERLNKIYEWIEYAKNKWQTPKK